MNSPVRSKETNRLSLSKRLYISAWCIEGFAATIGLFLAVVMIEQGYKADQTISLFALAIGALPVTIIAIVELMKIPLISAIYATRELITKIIFMFGLAILIVVTFETFFIAFEQSNAIRLSTWENSKRNLEQTKTKIQLLKTENSQLKSLTIKQIQLEYDEKKSNLQIKLKDKQDVLKATITDAERRFGGIQVVKLQSKKKSLEIERKNLTEYFSEAKKTIDKDHRKSLDLFYNNRDPLLKSRKDIKKELKLKESKIENKLNTLNRRLESSIDSTSIKNNRRYNQRRKNLEKNKERLLKRQDLDLKNALSEFETRIKINKDLLINSKEKKERCGLEIFCGDEIAEVKKYENEENTIKQSYKKAQNKIKLNSADRIYTKELNKLNNDPNTPNNSKISLIQKQISISQMELTKIRKSIVKNNAEINKTIESGQIRDLNRSLNLKLSSLENKKQNQINNINNAIAETRSRIERNLQINRPELNKITNKVEVEKEIILKRFRTELESLDSSSASEMKRFNGQQNQLQINQKGIDNLIAEREERVTKLKEAGRQQTVIRLAKMWYPDVKDETDVTEEHTKWMSTIWFGSLALIISLSGALFAWASLTVRYGRRTGEVNKNSFIGFIKKTGRRLGYVLVSVRRRINKPKIITKIVTKEVEVIKEIPVEVPIISEVVKEVPVEKVVIKEVPTEVIKEVIRKEIIHVPIATDDLRILNIQSLKSEDANNKDVEK